MNTKSILSLALAALFALVATPGTASAGIVHTDRVNANCTDVYEFTLPGGEWTRITVDGDGDTDLDLFIYDERGRLIDSDEDDTDYCVVSVRPRRTAKYTIKIKNWGDVYNEYQMTIE